MSIRVEVHSDFTCPFSYVTETELRAVAGAIPVTYRPYELFPAPAPLPAEHHGEWPTALSSLAAAAGVTLHRAPYETRTRKAHEAAAFASQRGLEGPIRDAIFRAYFVEGRDISRIDVLVEIGVSTGLDRSELKVVLDIDRYSDEVRLTRQRADDEGIQGVPTLRILGGTNETVTRVGAASAAEILEAISSARGANGAAPIMDRQ